jgi:hypothetical protein
LIAAGMPEAHTSQIAAIQMEQPARMAASASYAAPVARQQNPAVPTGHEQAPRQRPPLPPQPRVAETRATERAMPEPPTQPTKYADRAGRPLGRPQRSLDDLRGLRSMGQRQDARRVGNQPEEVAEVEMPHFLRRSE